MEGMNTSFERKGDLTIVNYIVRTLLQVLKNIAIYLSIVIIILLFSYIILNRYTIISAGEHSIYKINKLTGKIWFITGKEELEVKPYVRELDEKNKKPFGPPVLK